MAERVVSIKIVGDASGFSQAMGKVRDDTQATSKSITDSARNNREAWSTVGMGLTAVGVAITGVGVAALKTGISYNTLQQTSRAALTSILGSAAAANAQMDKLDDFARNSPFAKDMFIRAQQNMLAFGIEAKNVIPYLDAIQNAVAAAGGSNQDIAELAEIFGKVQASAKITAIDLQRFGRRGIDAADLIGQAMGKTGAQIREEITAGTIDADAALEALASGMADKFDGAADNVKNTFAGAMDRVKAAWRDFASELAKPLVDPDGGGALVDLLNWTADAMRNFEKLPEPIKNVVSGLTGLVGVGALVGGMFMLALPKVLAFSSALATLGVTRATMAAGLADTWRFLTGPWGIAMVAAAAVVYTFNSAMDASKVSSAQLETSIKQGKSALDEMRSSASQNEQGITKLFVNVSQHAENLGPLLDKAATSGRGFFSSLTFNEQAMLDNLGEFGVTLESLAVDSFPRAQQEFAKFGREAGLSREQLATALDEMPGFKAALLDYADAAGISTNDTTLLRLALGEIGPAAGDTAESIKEIQGIAETTTEAVSGLADEILNFGSATIDAERASLAFEEQIDKLNEHVAAGAAGLDKNTESGRANHASLLDMAEATNKSAAATLEATGSQEQATATLGRGREALIAAAMQYGMTEADAKSYADQVLATPESVSTWFSNNANAASMEVQRYRDMINSIRESVVTTLVTSLDVVSNLGKANGGTIGYAGGGTIASAANGLTIGGIGGGIASGTVFGQGTAKSDSILVRLSKGEEVIQEPYASANRGLLKSINRGDFHQGMMQPQIIVVPASGGDRSIVQKNEFHVYDRDERTFLKRAGRALTGAINS